MMKICILCLAIQFAISACSVQADNRQVDVEIHDIQGCSHSSPYEGQKVKDVLGVVTHKVSNGFTMQSVSPDELFCSSEGIFVFTKEYPEVMVADLVRVNGVVEEFADGKPEDHNLSQTEIVLDQYTVIQSENLMPDPILLDDMVGKMPTTNIENDDMSLFEPTKDGLDFYESLESMLVEIRSGIVVAPRNDYGEIIILPDDFSDNNLISSQGALLISQDDINPEKVMIKLPTNFYDQVNVGDRIESFIIGVMDYSYGNFKLLAFSPINFESTQQTIEPFSALSGGLTLATYNLENLSPMDENNKFKTIAKHIVKMLNSPDVLILNEVMDSSGSVDDDIVDAGATILKLINAIQKTGGPDYSYFDTVPINNQDGGIEGGNIRTVLLFRQDKGITLDENFSFANEIAQNDEKLLVKQNPMLMGENSSAFFGTRKPRVWLLTQNNKQFIVVGVHLTSQGANTPDWGNLQPPQKSEEVKRIDQAQLIIKQVSEIYLFKPNAPIFIAGDMNDLPWSKTIAEIQQDKFFNCSDIEEPEERYSYIYEGNAQQLDYIFVNQNLASDVLQARFIHVNTYLDQSDAFTDHDPMIIEFRLD